MQDSYCRVKGLKEKHFSLKSNAYPNRLFTLTVLVDYYLINGGSILSICRTVLKLPQTVHNVFACFATVCNMIPYTENAVLYQNYSEIYNFVVEILKIFVISF